VPRSASDQSILQRLRLPRHTLTICALAFAVGLLCYVLVWMNVRNNDFYKAVPLADSNTATVLEPLPQPLPAGAGASDMPDAPPVADASAPSAESTVAAPAPPTAEPAPPPAAVAPTATTPAAANAVASNDRPQPIAGQMPAPIYPASAQRRGKGGTVVVQVLVDANGMPDQVNVIQRSGTRALDRAAVKAAREWRFHPAHRDGQPAAASVDIPFDFKPGQ
jgi:protein TonB